MQALWGPLGLAYYWHVTSGHVLALSYQQKGKLLGEGEGMQL